MRLSGPGNDGGWSSRRPAAAHYVNSELDEGPIISQQVIEVDHTYLPEDLVWVGKDAECRALTNIVGNGVATVVVSAWERELDRNKLRAALSHGGDDTEAKTV